MTLCPCNLAPDVIDSPVRIQHRNTHTHTHTHTHIHTSSRARMDTINLQNSSLHCGLDQNERVTFPSGRLDNPLAYLSDSCSYSFVTCKILSAGILYRWSLETANQLRSCRSVSQLSWQKGAVGHVFTCKLSDVWRLWKTLAAQEKITL